MSNHAVLPSLSERFGKEKRGRVIYKEPQYLTHSFVKISLQPIKAIAYIKKPMESSFETTFVVFFLTGQAGFHSYFLARHFTPSPSEGLYQNKQLNPETAFKNYIVNNTEGMPFPRARLTACNAIKLD